MTTTVLNKTASVKLPGLGKLWKKKKLPLNQQKAMQSAMKVAAVRIKAPKVKIQPDLVNPSFLQKMRTSAPEGLKNLKGMWDRMGGTKSRAQSEALRNQAAANKGGDLNQTRSLHAAADKAGRTATMQKAMRNVGAGALGGAAVAPLMMGNHADGTPVSTPAAPITQENTRLQQRMGSPFGGLWDDIVNPESEADAAARTQRLQELGDNATLMQRWQLADPKIRYALLALLLGGGLGAFGAMRG